MVEPTQIFERTPKGQEELDTRRFHIPQRLRLALILVDGESDVQHLHDKAKGVDELDSLIETLESDGFIRAKDAAARPALLPDEEMDFDLPTLPIGDVKLALIAVAQEVLGGDASRVVTMLRLAADTPEGLATAVSRCKELVGLDISEEQAEKIQNRCRAILEQL